jgi:Leucine-rich repeat (LRR) protein
MKVIPGSRKQHYLVRASFFLITAVLVWTMMGCTTAYPTEYKLTISSTIGGTVVIPDEETSAHTEGTRVVLLAKPDDGYRFVSWTGDVGTIGNVHSAQTQIRIRGDCSVTAEFEEIPVYHLAVSTTVGGEVVKPGAGMFTYDGGSVVKLEAHEYVSYGFVNWTGNVKTIANVNAAVTTITMDGNYSIRANFEGEAAVNITDTGLEEAIRVATRISDRPVYPSDLKRLASLEAEARNVSDLTALEYCTGLTRLCLCDNQIDDILPVANLTGLTYLDLSGNQIGDMSPVANLTGLAYLDLSGNQISDVSAVIRLARLRQFYLSGNHIGDILALASLTGLRELYLSHNHISDISVVASLTGLRELYLSHNDISDISVLGSLTGLRDLHLSNNHISDVSALTSLTSLRDLSLGDNQIDDISPLANLSNLTLLNLSGNQISDIQPLVDNPGLSQGDRVYLYDNPLSYSPLTFSAVGTCIAQLEVRGVIVEY